MVSFDEMSDDYIGVVLDAGSSTTKAGFAKEAFPRAVFPTAVSRFRMQTGITEGLPTICCGNEAVLNRGLTNMGWPVQDGFINNWDEMEILWHHTFYKELMVPPEQTRVMHSVHPLASRRDKERMAEILFEVFTVDGIYLMRSPALVLHASGRTSGLVWEVGSSSSYVAPVFEGFPLKHATLISALTGELLTDRLQKLLINTGYSFTTAAERDLLNGFKAEHCYVAQDYNAELEAMLSNGESKITHQLPDGQQIYLGAERIKCTEVLFKPELENLNCLNIAALIHSSVNNCEADTRSMFYDNIVLAGGTSLFPGLVDRLQTELTNDLRNQTCKAKIDAMPSRQYAAWTGGSIVSSLSTLKDFWMTKEDYDDGGADRVKYKFF